MDGQRQGWGRSRRRKARSAEPRGAKPEPVRIVARRPDSPLLGKAPGRALAASVVPQKKSQPAPAREDPTPEPAPAPKIEAPRRAARIVQFGGEATDEHERERRKLLARLMQSDGRGAISRASDEFLRRGFELPDEQEVHLQLLEHFDEARARESLAAMSRLLRDAPPIKRPVLEQRLRRLEEYADEAATRDLAAELRRTLRT